MAKRKKLPSGLTVGLIRWTGVFVITAVFVFFSFQAISSFLHHARTFDISQVSVSGDLGDLDIPELGKMKGRNIFEADLKGLQEKISARYPRIGGVKIVRRLPNEIAVSGFRREPVATTVLGGRSAVLSQDGSLMAVSSDDPAGLPLVKGLKFYKTISGTSAGSAEFSLVYSIIDTVRNDHALQALRLRSVDIHDPEKITCVFGEGRESFEVFLSRQGLKDEKTLLREMVGRRGLDLAAIQYIDLRYRQPVIGPRKTRR